MTQAAAPDHHARFLRLRGVRPIVTESSVFFHRHGNRLRCRKCEWRALLLRRPPEWFFRFRRVDSGAPADINRRRKTLQILFACDSFTQRPTQQRSASACCSPLLSLSLETETGTQIHRQSDRQLDRLTDRQIDYQIDRCVQADSQAKDDGLYAEIRRDRDRQLNNDIQTDRQL